MGPRGSMKVCYGESVGEQHILLPKMRNRQQMKPFRKHQNWQAKHSPSLHFFPRWKREKVDILTTQKTALVVSDKECPNNFRNGVRPVKSELVPLSSARFTTVANKIRRELSFSEGSTEVKRELKRTRVNEVEVYFFKASLAWITENFCQSLSNQEDQSPVSSAFL